MTQSKPINKIIDFLKLLTLGPQQLICVINYQNFRKKGRSAALELYDYIIGPLGFIKTDKKSNIFRNVYYLSYTWFLLQAS